MLNSGYKKSSLIACEQAGQEYKKQYEDTIQRVTVLHNTKEQAKKLLVSVESLICSISSKPKELEKDVYAISVRIENFEKEIISIQKKAELDEKLNKGAAGAGVAAGVGVASFGPSAAMAIATTFGTASTGTAIASLSGAAATNAALAWLGGGALAVGGGGMAGGSAFLALAGPAGWAIGGAALVGSGLMASSRNKKIAREAEEKTRKIRCETSELQKLQKKVDDENLLLRKMQAGVSGCVNASMKLCGSNFNEFTEIEKYELMRLINMSEALSSRIGEKITDVEENDISRNASRNSENQQTANESVDIKLDKYDYMIAGFCGAAAGLIDAFFVKNPEFSLLGKQTDKVQDGVVIKTSQLFWQFDTRQKGKPKKRPETLVQCISYLEQAFPVTYDARYAKDLNVAEGVLKGMAPRNHHLLSLAHSPDLVGLIFSIIDQYSGLASFVDKGKVIRVEPARTSGAIPYLQGANMPSMIFCGFVNWIGHLLSDSVGASSTRRREGRGAGIPILFYELFLEARVGNINGDTFADVMVQVFEEGYDFRFGAAMAIPVMLEELFIRVLWMVRQKFCRNKSLIDCIPTTKHSDLRMMLLIGNGTLCAIDGVDAVIRGKGNLVVTICHLNLIGWARLVTLAFSELRIRYGPAVLQALRNYIDAAGGLLPLSDQREVERLAYRLSEFEQDLQAVYSEYVEQIEAEYEHYYSVIDAAMDRNTTPLERMHYSANMADEFGVAEDRIVRTEDDLKRYFKE